VSERKLGIFFKIKEGENYNHPSTICQTYPSTIFRSYGAGGAGRNTLSYFEDLSASGGLKSKSDPEGIGSAPVE